MPLTPAPLRSLLGLCLCLCLLLGGVAGTEVGKTQPQGDGVNGEPGLPTLPPYLLQLKNMATTLLPTITKNGDLYFDLARVKETSLKIKKNESVLGITATSRKCPVESLGLGRDASYILDEDLFTFCPITNLTLTDRRWCRREGKLLQRRGLVVSFDNATCRDSLRKLNSTHTIQYGMEEGVQRLQEFNITSCLIEECDCRWYFSNDWYDVNMDCSGRGLTDDALAKMKMTRANVTRVSFARNNLSSIDTVLAFLKPNHEKIIDITLDNNQITELPRLGKLFPRIVDISLVNNLIVKIDLEEFKALVARKGFHLPLEDNPIPCDDTMSAFKDIITDLCTEEWKFCPNYMGNLTCRRESDGERVPLYKIPGSGYVKPWNWWTVLNVTLGILNVIMIALMVDLVLILAKKGGDGRRPMMDYAVCGLRALLCCLWRGGRVRSNKRD